MNDSLSAFLKQHGRMIAIAIVVVLGVLALFLLMKSFAAMKDLGEDYNYSTITITGKGTAEAPPTIAELVFTVQETAATVAEAQEVATTRTTTALDALYALDIENEDVRTSGYNVNPQYENQPCRDGFCNPGSPTISGYQVSQTVTVKVRNPDNAGPALQALGNAGVQNISGPNFTVDDDSDVMQEARGEAIEDAHKQARVLAEQLGVKLGDVVSFSEGDGGYPSPMSEGYGGAMMDMARSVANPPLPQGVNESEVSVMITYKIK
jgi:uncharacterized protein YggE